MSTLQVYSGNEHCTQLIFRSLQQSEYFVVESSISLVENVFPGLNSLLFNEVVSLSTKAILGVLVSNEESVDHLCSIIPLSELGLMCERALSMNEIKTFLQICFCSLPNLAIFDCDESKSTKKRIDSTSVRLPANFIWSLLVLSEYFCVSFVMQQCKKQLLQKVLLVLPSSESGSSSNGINSSSASDSLFSILSDQSLVPSLVQAINIHLLKFGPRVSDAPTAPTTPSHNNKMVQPAAPAAPVDSPAPTASEVTEPSLGTPPISTPTTTAAAPSSVSAAVSLFDDDATPHRPHNRESQQPQLQHQYQQQVPSTPPRSSPSPSLGFSPSPIPKRLLLSNGYSTSSSSATPYVTRSTDYYSDDVSYSTPHFSSSSAAPPLPPPAAATAGLEVTSAPNRSGRSSSGSRKHSSPLSRSVSPTAMQNRRMNATAAAATTTSSSAPPPARSVSPSSGFSSSRLVQPPMVHNPNLHPSPPPHYYQEGAAAAAAAASVANGYSEDQLRLSREVALLRLSEVRVKEEWLRLQQLGEKTLRDNRLKTLQLQAEVARYHSVSTSATSAASPEGAYMVATNPHSLNKQSLAVVNQKKSAAVAPVTGRRNNTSDVKRQQTAAAASSSSSVAIHSSDRDIHEIYKSVASNGVRAAHLNTPGTPPSRGSAAGRGSVGGGGGRPSSVPPSRPTVTTTTTTAAVASAGSAVNGVDGVKTRAQLTAEEARHRAAIRIKQKRQQDKEKENDQHTALTETQMKLFQQRDEKIARFRDRQLFSSSEAYITSDVTPSPGGRGPHLRSSGRSSSGSSSNRVNRKYSPMSADKYDLMPLTDDEGGEEEEESRERSSGSRGRGLYSSEALRAVGQGLSPNSAAAQTSLLTPHRGQHRYSQVQGGVESSPQEAYYYLNSNNTTAASFTSDGSGGSLPSSPDILSTTATTTQRGGGVLTIVVLRATDLVECLGCTSAYVTFDWGRQYGRNSTQCVRDSCNPSFNSILKFRLPKVDFSKLSPSTEVDVPPVKVLVFNRRESVSDELIAQGELDIVGIMKTNMLTNNDGFRSDVHSLYLTNEYKEFAGYVDVSVDY